MALDPLTALSVAGTVVQLIEYGSKIFSAGWELHKASTGALEANNELELVTKDMRAIIIKLGASFYSTQESGPLTREEHELAVNFKGICNETVKLAEEILRRLENLKVGVKHRAWKSFQQAVRAAWSKEEIARLVERLSKMKATLEAHVLMSISANLDVASIRISSRFDSLDCQTQRIITALIDHRASASDTVLQEVRDQNLAITQLLNRLEVMNLNEHLRTRTTVTDIALSVLAATRDPHTNTSPSSAEKTARDLVETIILDSLSFSTRTTRYEEILPAYRKTFNWIFHDSTSEQLPWSNFSNWLTSGKGVYWIKGKAGSGKSTLMRCIYDDIRTKRYLATWADGDPLWISAFFFWNSGTLEQRSQVGLLKALLYDVLQEHRELIPVVLPWHWARTYSRSISQLSTPAETWSLSRLMEAFTILIGQSMVSLKLFLLIDGLDEFEGDHKEISELFKNVTSSANVKVCLSSRPWIVFENCFQACPGLRLQDLTYSDIKHYVHEKFYNDSSFERLANEEPQKAPEIVKGVVGKADGVFLWVAIVVKSLLSGIRNRDGISDLQIRLDALPRDLEPLYEHMLKHIEPAYDQKASQIFQIVRVSLNHSQYFGFERWVCKPLTVLSLYFAVTDNMDMRTVKNYSIQDLNAKSEEMEIQLTARCAGLLEVSRSQTGFSRPIQYLHRTARDFLQKSDIWEMLLNHTAMTEFNPNSSMLQSCVMQLENRSATGFDDRERTAMCALTYAYYTDLETHRSNAALLDRLDAAMSSFRPSNRPGLNHWSNVLYAKGNELITPTWHTSFLSLAVQWGLSAYVAEKLGKITQKELLKLERPLLDCAVSHAPFHCNYPSRPETVQLLLSRGADPNQKYQGSTLWKMILLYLEYNWETIQLDPQEALRFLGVLEALVRAGADKKAEIGLAQRPLGIITRTFGGEFPKESAELIRTLSGGRISGVRVQIHRRIRSLVRSY